MARVTRGPETTGGKGSAVEKKHDQATTPGHQHGQKLVKGARRGDANYRKDGDRTGNESGGGR